MTPRNDQNGQLGDLERPVADQRGIESDEGVDKLGFSFWHLRHRSLSGWLRSALPVIWSFMQFVLGFFFPAREVLLVQKFCVSSFSERQHPADNAAFAKMTYKHVHPPAWVLFCFWKLFENVKHRHSQPLEQLHYVFFFICLIWFSSLCLLSLFDVFLCGYFVRILYVFIIHHSSIRKYLSCFKAFTIL